VPERPHPDAHSSVDAVLRRAAELELTDAQREALQDIDARQTEKIDALRSESKPAQSSESSPPPTGRRGGGRRRDPMSVGGGQAQIDRRRAQRFRIDELDNAAFLEAEAKLEEAQRPKARQIATEYRAALFDYRHWRDQTQDDGTSAE
jgi:hypothetical protein